MLDPMCVYVGVERVLPVFSFEEEANLFLRLGSYEGHWRARERCAVDLVSVLRGPCADVKSVALDPLPEMLEDACPGRGETEELSGAHTCYGEASSACARRLV